MTEKLGSMVQGLLALGCLAASLVLTSPASAENAMAGVYQGFLAFDYKGEEVREWMMISFHEDGTLIMGAEEGHDEPVDPDTGLATRNDVESANLGLWRMSAKGRRRACSLVHKSPNLPCIAGCRTLEHSRLTCARDPSWHSLHHCGWRFQYSVCGQSFSEGSSQS